MHLIEFNGEIVAIESFDEECFSNQIQLEYYVDSSCVSLQNIRAIIPDLLNEYEHKTYYYRSQIDNILYCCGCIHDVMNHTAASKIPDLYDYSSAVYPNISNREGRNLVMHLFERNRKILDTEGIVGGFNVIFYHGDEIDLAVRNKNKNLYAYTLDLQDMKVFFHDMQRDQRISNGCNPDYEIDLKELEKELLKLKQRVRKVRESFINTEGSMFRTME